MMRKPTKALFVSVITVFMIVFSVSTNVALAQESLFPSKPINLIIGAAPGAATELPTRALAKAAEKVLGQPIVCSNLPGAAGARAMGQVVKAKPDGYTLVNVNCAGQITSIVEKLNYALPDDFSPIIQFQTIPLPFLVRKDAPWNTWQEIIKYAREHKGKVTVAIFGSKGTPWLVLHQIEKRENAKFIFAPYPGGGQAATAILGGHVTATITVSSIMYAKSGELKLLLVFSDHRLKDFQDVPTAIELYGSEGVAFDGGYNGIVAPKGLPKPILAKLHDAFRKATEDQDFIRVSKGFDLVISYRSAEEFTELLKRTDNVVKEFLKEEGKQ